MIYKKLKSIDVEESANILYELYRIFHKAKDGIYQTEFSDSDLTFDEKKHLSQIISAIELKKHLFADKFLSRKFIELDKYQEHLLSRRLKADQALGAEKLYSITKMKSQNGLVRSLFYAISIAACVIFVFYLIIPKPEEPTKSDLNYSYNSVNSKDYFANMLEDAELTSKASADTTKKKVSTSQKFPPSFKLLSNINSSDYDSNSFDNNPDRQRVSMYRQEISFYKKKCEKFRVALENQIASARKAEIPNKTLSIVNSMPSGFSNYKFFPSSGQKMEWEKTINVNVQSFISKMPGDIYSSQNSQFGYKIDTVHK